MTEQSHYRDDFLDGAPILLEWEPDPLGRRTAFAVGFLAISMACLAGALLIGDA